MQTRSYIALLLLTLATAAAAEQQVANQIVRSRPAGAYRPDVIAVPRAAPPAGLRKAADGTVNFIVMVGNAPDGSREQRYAKRQAETIGGYFFHGQFSGDDVIAWMVACAKAGTKVDGMVFIGHMNELQADAVADVIKDRDVAWAPLTRKRNDKGELENRVGFVHPGYNGSPNASVDHMANWNRDAFVGKLETAIAQAQLRSDQVFTDRCRVVFRVCETGVFARKMLEELAKLLPAGGEVVGYDIPYVWNFTQYPLGFTTYRPDPEQTNGRFVLPGGNRSAEGRPAGLLGVMAMPGMN